MAETASRRLRGSLSGSFVCPLIGLTLIPLCNRSFSLNVAFYVSSIKRSSWTYRLTKFLHLQCQSRITFSDQILNALDCVGPPLCQMLCACALCQFDFRGIVSV